MKFKGDWSERKHIARQELSKQIAWVKQFIAKGGDHLHAAAAYRRHLAEIEASKREGFRRRQAADLARRLTRKQKKRVAKAEKKAAKHPNAKPVKHKAVPQVVRPSQRPVYRSGLSSSDFYRTWEWCNLRYQILKHYGCKCLHCGAPGNHVDHIKPRSKYPHLELDPDNLQVLCEPCNVGKSNLYEDDWRNRGPSPSPPAME